MLRVTRYSNLLLKTRVPKISFRHLEGMTVTIPFLQQYREIFFCDLSPFSPLAHKAIRPKDSAHC